MQMKKRWTVAMALALGSAISIASADVNEQNSGNNTSSTGGVTTTVVTTSLPINTAGTGTLGSTQLGGAGIGGIVFTKAVLLQGDASTGNSTGGAGGNAGNSQQTVHVHTHN